eukprot:PhF_6_TR16630/c0_g1_i1/m.25319
MYSPHGPRITIRLFFSGDYPVVLPWSVHVDRSLADGLSHGEQSTDIWDPTLIPEVQAALGSYRVKSHHFDSTPRTLNMRENDYVVLEPIQTEEEWCKVRTRELNRIIKYREAVEGDLLFHAPLANNGQPKYPHEDLVDTAFEIAHLDLLYEEAKRRRFHEKVAKKTFHLLNKVSIDLLGKHRNSLLRHKVSTV